MVRSEKKHRIIFIDLIRALAVIQMVQGHTIDALLAPEYRSLDYPAYYVWNFMRGITAPVFMFSAGTVFTYLLRLVNEPFENNPRVKKGFRRFIFLVVIGYLLRYPTYTVFDFSNVTQKNLDIFFSVDVLQLIGFGLLFLLISAFIAEKTKLSDTIVFLLISLIFFIAAPFVTKINWIDYLPQPIAGYFYTGTGSLFPLFPWAGYVVFGGILGSYLAKNPLVFKSNRFSFNLALYGAVFIIISEAALVITNKVFNYYYDNSSYNLDTIFFRLGFVLVLNSIVSFISQNIESIPKIIIIIGRNTLIIYVVHLIILYGSAWNPGLSVIFGSKLDVTPTIIIAISMITLMVLMVFVFNKLKFRNKQLVT